MQQHRELFIHDMVMVMYVLHMFIYAYNYVVHMFTFSRHNMD